MTLKRKLQVPELSNFFSGIKGTTEVICTFDIKVEISHECIGLEKIIANWLLWSVV